MSRKKERDNEQAKPHRGGGDVQSKQVPAVDVESGHFSRIGTLVDLRGGLGDDAELIEDIEATLRIIEELRASAHEDDEEMARLGEETRRLIGEMQKELKVA